MNTVELNKNTTSDTLMNWAAGIGDCHLSLELIRQELSEADGFIRHYSVINLIIGRLDNIQEQINNFDLENL